MKFFPFLVFVIVCGSLVFVGLHLWSSSDAQLDRDEVDYLAAAERGILANALEIGSLNLKQFAQLGLSRAIHSSPPDLSANEESQDPFLLRHFHPPLPVYYWRAFTSRSIVRQDRNLRVSNLILGIVTILLLTAAAYRILPSTVRTALLGIAIFVPVFATSRIFILTLRTLNFHIFHSIACVGFIYLLFRFLYQRSNRNGFYLGLAAAGLILTLETGVLTLGGAIFGIMLVGKRRELSWPNGKPILTAVLLTLILIWPAILTTGGPLKSWAMYLYRVFLFDNLEYRKVSPLAAWQAILTENALLSSCIIAALLLATYAYKKRVLPRLIFLPFVIGFIYALVISPFVLRRPYVMPSLTILVFASILVCESIDWGSRKSFLQWCAVTLGLVVLGHGFLTTNFHEIHSRSEIARDELSADFAAIVKVLQCGDASLADGGNILRYYLGTPKERLSDLYIPYEPGAKFLQRVEHAYADVTDLVRRGRYCSIIFRKRRENLEDQYKSLLAWGYTRQDLNQYVVFFR